MAEVSNQQLLQQNVVNASVADDWEVAKREWDLVSIYSNPSTCVCGHEIVENCVIQNRNNNNRLIVGNVCVNHFGEQALSNCRTSLKSITNAPDETWADAELVDLAGRLHILSHKECIEYHGLRESGNSLHPDHPDFDGQMFDQRWKINQLLILGFSKDRPLCMCDLPAKPRMNNRHGTFFYSCQRWNPNGIDCCAYNIHAFL